MKKELSILWMGVTQSDETLSRTKTDLHKEEGIMPADALGLGTRPSLDLQPTSPSCRIQIQQVCTIYELTV